jgi:hypothetical protein
MASMTRRVRSAGARPARAASIGLVPSACLIRTADSQSYKQYALADQTNAAAQIRVSQYMGQSLPAHRRL